MAVNRKVVEKNPEKTPPTREFIVIGGGDDRLWGDIDSSIDSAWQEKVWKLMISKKSDKSNENS
jgi:hypothetical protein